MLKVSPLALPETSPQIYFISTSLSHHPSSLPFSSLFFSPLPLLFPLSLCSLSTLFYLFSFFPFNRPSFRHRHYFLPLSSSSFFHLLTLSISHEHSLEQLRCEINHTPIRHLSHKMHTKLFTHTKLLVTSKSNHQMNILSIQHFIFSYCSKTH